MAANSGVKLNLLKLVKDGKTVSVEVVGSMDVRCRPISSYTFSRFLKEHL